MKIKVAVVGASGVLGRNLVSLFQREGRAVRALVRFPENIKGLLADDSEALPCDLLKIPDSLLTEYLKGCDVAIHAASALPSRPYEKRGSEWELNNRLRMEGTSKLIEAARRAGVGLYLQQSVVSVYVNGDDRWLDESASFDILPHRVVETLAVADMERRVKEINPRTMGWAILRGGTFVGPGTEQERLIGRIRRMEETVEGEGSHFFSPVHVEDMARAFVKAACVKPRGGIYNVVDEPLRYGDYVDYLADRERAARPKRVRSVTKFASQRCSNEAARKQLGWFPIRSFYSPEVIAIGA
jgi:nucleoside-diphosphate-sugar epimerase